MRRMKGGLKNASRLQVGSFSESPRNQMTSHTLEYQLSVGFLERNFVFLMLLSFSWPLSLPASPLASWGWAQVQTRHRK